MLDALVAGLLIFSLNLGASPRLAGEETQRAPKVEKLAKALSGTWNITIVLEPSEQMPKGGKGHGEEVWKPGPGGFSLIEEYSSTGDEGEISGLGVFWWDRDAARFQVTWCDSTSTTGCSVIKRGARWRGEEMVLEDERQDAGKQFTFREVFSNMTGNSFTQTIYQGEAAGMLKKVVTISATRKDENPRAGTRGISPCCGSSQFAGTATQPMEINRHLGTGNPRWSPFTPY
jgi:hypothetical protein